MTEDIAAAGGGYAAGSRIAGYLLQEQIGQGGMAVVFRALDERLDRQVALKVLAPALAADKAFRQRFIRESRAAAAVDDPHIIPVFEAGDADGVLFIAMRYVPGGDVRSLASELGRLPLSRAADIISQAAAALDAAHRRGLVHRDVKPANMLLDTTAGTDHVYLSDFGLSKPSLAATGLTGTGQFLGTLDYVAPEQIEGNAVDGRADEYSLACAAFELLTGEPPFRRAAAMTVMYAQLYEQPPPATSRRPDLPPAADLVFARALAKAQADRYDGCREFADALRSALGLVAYDSDSPDAPALVHPPTEIARRAAPAAAYAQLETGEAAPPVRPSGPTSPISGGGSRKPLAAAAGYPVQPRDGGRRRPTPAVLIGICILLAAGVVAAAILATAPGSVRGAASAGNAGASSPGTGSSVAPTGSASPGAGQAGAGTSDSPGPGSGGSPGYQFAGTLDPGADGSLSAVAWTPDSTLAATADKNGSVYLWDAATGSLHGRPLTPPGCEEVFGVAISASGSTLAAGCKNGSVYVWQLATGRLMFSLPDPGGVEVDCVAFSPHGTTLAASDGNGNTYLWDAGTGHLIATLPDPAGHGVWSVVFSNQGMLATGDYYGNVYLWDVAARSVASSFRMPASGYGDPATALAFSANGSLLAASDLDGSTYLSNVGAQSRQLISSPPGFAVWALSFNNAGMLAMADADGMTYLWNVDQASLAVTTAGTLTDPGSGKQGVGSLAFSPSGKWLVTGDTNGRAYSWRPG